MFENWLPHYLAMGMTKNEFMHSTPKVLKAYGEAYKIKIHTMDRLAWQFCGSYVLSAVTVAVEHCLAGKKAKSEYMDKPVLERVEAANKPMGEDEIQRQRDLFVAKLMVMQANYKMNHKPKETGGELNDIK